MTDRDRILSRIRKARRRDAEPPLPPRFGPPPRPADDLDEAVLARTFRQEAEAQAVGVHEAAGPSEAVRILAEILEGLGAKTAFSWNAPFPGRSAVSDALRACSVQDLTPAPERPGEVPDHTGSKAAGARADVGITGADFALADTGTLVLLSAPGQSRSASLLPAVHLALLPASRILPDLPSLLALLPRGPTDALERGSAVTLVTGTSKTADIELTLVRGVHGPREVHVILLPGASL